MAAFENLTQMDRGQANSDGLMVDCGASTTVVGEGMHGGEVGDFEMSRHSNCFRSKPEDVVPPPIPEPQHRIACSSSGLSVRDLPSASTEEIRKTCRHYERKCSGKYSSTSLAARYVFQLSREVQAMLISLEEHLLGREKRVSFLEMCCSEWDQLFGSGSNTQQMTPARLNEVLSEREAEITHLNRLIETRQRRHEAEIRRFEASMDEHCAASRLEYHTEVARLETSHATNVERLREAHRNELGAQELRLRQAFERSNEKCTAGHKKEVDRLQASIVELTRTTSVAETTASESIEANRLKHAAEMKDALAVHRAEHDERIAELQRRLDGWEEERRAKDAVREEQCDARVACVRASLEDAWRNDKRRAAELSVENAYLRSRVQDLQRLCNALQAALGPMDAPPK